jgi:hypothetical protein
MDRKTFIQKSAGALLLAAPAYVLLSCSSSDDSNPNCTNTSISDNHGHSISVSKNDVNAAVEKIYNITGSGDHPHNVTVSAANFNTLKNNQQISVTSTEEDGHNHSVTISCA